MLGVRVVQGEFVFNRGWQSEAFYLEYSGKCCNTLSKQVRECMVLTHSNDVYVLITSRWFVDVA